MEKSKFIQEFQWCSHLKPICHVGKHGMRNALTFPHGPVVITASDSAVEVRCPSCFIPKPIDDRNLLYSS